jgi:hypothetical protein
MQPAVAGAVNHVLRTELKGEASQVRHKRVVGPKDLRHLVPARRVCQDVELQRVRPQLHGCGAGLGRCQLLAPLLKSRRRPQSTESSGERAPSAAAVHSRPSQPQAENSSTASPSHTNQESRSRLAVSCASSQGLFLGTPRRRESQIASGSGLAWVLCSLYDEHSIDRRRPAPLPWCRRRRVAQASVPAARNQCLLSQPLPRYSITTAAAAAALGVN